jgi:hypothetical protein
MRVRPSTEIRASFNNWLSGRVSNVNVSSDSNRDSSKSNNESPKRFPTPETDGGISGMRPESAVRASGVRHSNNIPETNGMRNMRPESERVKARATRHYESAMRTSVSTMTSNRDELLTASNSANRYFENARQISSPTLNRDSGAVQWGGRSSVNHWNVRKSSPMQRFPKGKHERPRTLTESQKRDMRVSSSRSTSALKSRPKANDCAMGPRPVQSWPRVNRSTPAAPRPFGQQFCVRRKMLSPKSPRFERKPLRKSDSSFFPSQEEPKTTFPQDDTKKSSTGITLNAPSSIRCAKPVVVLGGKWS